MLDAGSSATKPPVLPSFHHAVSIPHIGVLRATPDGSTRCRRHSEQDDLMNKTAAAVFSAAAVAAAMLAGRRAGPQHPREAIWYSRLEKPSYTPSGPVIGATWTGLDILLGLSGARLLAARPGL